MRPISYNLWFFPHALSHPDLRSVYTRTHTAFLTATHTYWEEEEHEANSVKTSKLAKPWAQKPNGILFREFAEDWTREEFVSGSCREEFRSHPLLGQNRHLVLLPKS